MYFAFQASMIGVRSLRNILFALTALAWLVTTMHCRLETVPGLQFLACKTATPPSNPNSHCDDNGCCAAEKSQYRTEQDHLTLPAQQFFLSSVPVLDVPKALPDEVRLGLLTAAPPELPKTWQFSLRAALPVRAPSFAS